MIKAPYNFVPLASNVVFPDWAKNISIDHPFEDGISGTISVNYKALTPVFIGNGKKADNSTGNYTAASGEFALPGSSLRGMLRNVVEIISFSKFNRIDNTTLSIRDLHNPDLYGCRMTSKIAPNHFKAKAKSGWLIFENDVWTLSKVEHHRVENSDIAKAYNLKLSDFENQNEPDDRIKLLQNNVSVYYQAGEQEPHSHHKGLKLYYSKVTKISKTEFDNANQGYLVLTGQPGRYNGRGKHMDFVFEPPSGNVSALSKELVNQFKEANTPKAADQKRGLDLIAELKKYKNLGYPGLPVFYLEENGKIASLGRSQMYRLPYTHSLYDAIKNSSEDNFNAEKMDMAECIFGDGKMTLKSRVQFEDAITQTSKKEATVQTILGNPKPSFYPNYIKQGGGKYKTLMDKDVKLRGWKRYPVRETVNPISVKDEQENVSTRFEPLPKGTQFKGEIHFHNLKSVELGALLWAITWGGDSNLSHSIGMGKPYGFGQVKASIQSIDFLKNDSTSNIYQKADKQLQELWCNDFAEYIKNASNIQGWENCAQIRELKAMANPGNAKRSGWELEHMDDPKDFAKVKGRDHQEFLARYSEGDQAKTLTKTSSLKGFKAGRF